MSQITCQQQKAIMARGNVLVSAGAGTGKTHTVTQRCLDLILRERCSVEEILMVTFTEAAAAEMRERIRKALLAAMAQAATDSSQTHWLTEQVALLDNAPISTMHSFCLEIVRQHFHLLGLDPQFVVLDDSQKKPLIHATMDELFNRHYDGATATSAAVKELVQRYGGGADSGLRKLIWQIHQHAQVLPSPDRWHEEQRKCFEAAGPDAWRDMFVEAVADWAQLWLEPLVEFADVSPNVAVCHAALAKLFQSEVSFEQTFMVLAKLVDADQAEWKRGTKTKVRKLVEGFFNDAVFLHELAQTGGAALAQDWEWVRGPMLALLGLTRDFARDFARAKRELGGIDFSDQEQFALRLLQDESNGVAAACRERFKYVFVDECQDINLAQDAIINAVSREGTAANRFLVGDAKQSIYRFRLADPRIFQRYQNEWSGSDAGNSASVLQLSENFRSRKAVLQFINPVFRALMRPALGNLIYDAAAELQFGDVAGRTAQPQPADTCQPCAELHIITKDGNTDDSAEDEGASITVRRDVAELNTVEREAYLIACRFKELKKRQLLIWDKDSAGFREVDWKDMVVLLRGVSGRTEIYAKAFHKAGVPLRAARGGFLDAQEVADVLNLLRLLDNPLQDLPLLGVLRSPFVGLSAEELVELRLLEPKRKLFWEIITDKSATKALSAELQTKLSQFVNQFHRWRELIRHSSLTHCLEIALKETHYEALLSAEDRGEEQVGNIRQLIELARRFDPFKREGLFRFLKFIADQQQADVDLEPAMAADGNAVRLMTIHASKGLEFSVVAVAGLGARFNLRDLSSDILLDEDFGLCPKVLPPDVRSRYPSIAHWMAAQKGRRAALGEELRLLYVALTRARDQLLLVGTATRKEELPRWREPVRLTDLALVKAGCFLDWFRLWFVNWAHDDDWIAPEYGENTLLRWKFYEPGDAAFSALEKLTGAVDKTPAPTTAELALLSNRLDFRYAHEPATYEAAKTSVTGLRRRYADAVDDEVAQIYQSPARREELSLPHKSSTKAGVSQLSAAERGTVHHEFLQVVDFSETMTALDLRNEAARLEAAGVFSPDQVAALDFAALEKFCQSDYAAEMRSMPLECIHREMPFTARFAAEELRQLAGGVAEDFAADEFVVVQGTVDLVVLQAREIWLLDFKTDDVEEADLLGKAKHYELQLKLYALALERIYNRPVTDCRLWFLTAGRSVKIK